MPKYYSDTDQQRIYNEKVAELNNWNRRVASINEIFVPQRYVDRNPERFAKGNVKNKYYHFTGFVRSWVEELLATPEDDPVGDAKIDRAIEDLREGRTDLMTNWWQKAQLIATGKQVKNDLPTFKNVTEENKRHVYDSFLPAYRAIREKFEKRFWIEFIFNHRQYTAERDSLRAIEAVVSTLTGDGKEQIQTRLDRYVREIPSGDIATASKILRGRITQNQPVEEFADSVSALNGEGVRNSFVVQDLQENTLIGLSERHGDSVARTNSVIHK